MRNSVTALWMPVMLAVLAFGCNPAPYDVTVLITDKDGFIIPLAQVILLEVDDVQVADNDGQVTWTGLSKDTASLVVTAEGHLMETAQVTLKRGHNEVAVPMRRGYTGAGFPRT